MSEMNHKQKYKFTGETMEFEGRTLRQIVYLRSIMPFIVKGKIGGWIESENNLSHEGSCCVIGNAKVYGNARVTDSGLVTDTAIVKDNAKIKENSVVAGQAIVGADTIVSDVSLIEGESEVFFYANEKYGESNITGKSIIEGKTIIEATGTIYYSRICNEKLYGFLEMENQILITRKYKGDSPKPTVSSPPSYF